MQQTTLLFANETGDKIHIEIQITGDPDQVINALKESFYNGAELFPGAKCTSILFKGVGVDRLVNQAKIDFINGVKGTVERLKHDLNLDVSAPSREEFLKTMLDWHEEFLAKGYFKIPLDHEQSEYLWGLAARLAKVYSAWPLKSNP